MPAVFQVRLGTTDVIAIDGTGTEGTTMVTFPISSTYKTISSTVVDSARNIKGFIVAKVIREGIRKIELSWRTITIADYAKLGRFFNNNFMFYAYYFDQDSNAWICKQFYVGDREADALQNKQWVADANGGGIKPEFIENFKLSLIEV